MASRTGAPPPSVAAPAATGALQHLARPQRGPGLVLLQALIHSAAAPHQSGDAGLCGRLFHPYPTLQPLWPGVLFLTGRARFLQHFGPLGIGPGHDEEMATCNLTGGLVSLLNGNLSLSAEIKCASLMCLGRGALCWQEHKFKESCFSDLTKTMRRIENDVAMVTSFVFVRILNCVASTSPSTGGSF